MPEWNWQFREGGLKALKGVRLSVLMCLALHANQRGRAWPKYTTIQQETDYATQAVSGALEWLQNHRAILLVPHAKRIGPEIKLGVRRYVYQCTGVIEVEDGFIPYWYLKPEDWETLAELILEVEPTFDVLIIKSLNLHFSKLLISEPRSNYIKSLEGNSKEIGDGKKKPPKPIKETIPQAQMTAMKNALAAAFGWDWAIMTDDEKGQIQKAAKGLCTAKLDPAAVQNLYRWCKGQDWGSFKPTALAGHLSEWRAATRATNGADGNRVVRGNKWDE